MIRTSSLLRRSVTAGALLAAASSLPASAVNVDRAVDFESLGIVAGADGINLAPPHVLRIASADDRVDIADLISLGYESSQLVAGVVEVIGDIEPGRVVLIGVIDESCTPAEVAGLERSVDGDLVMTAPGHEPEPIECFVANITVAVLSVAAEDAPPGSTDHADLVAFELLGPEPAQATAVELDADGGGLADILPASVTDPQLPALEKGDRRFAFLLAGCRNETAELLVTRNLIGARFGEQGAACYVPEYYLAVLDVAEHLIPPGAQLTG